MSRDLTVANTILEQLGGRKFLVMTGAHSLTGGDNSLSMKLPKTKHGNRCGVLITLEPSDTYTFKLLQMKGSIDNGDLRMEEIDTHEDIYWDMLPEVFKRATGLATQ